MENGVLIQKPKVTMNPHLIGAGIGLLDRKETSGLLAVFEAASLVNVGLVAAEKLLERVGAGVTKAGERIPSIARELEASSDTDDELRHKLWLRVVQGLEVDALLPLSERRAAETSSALGVMASRVLSPALHAQETQRRNGNKHAIAQWQEWLDEIWEEPKKLWTDKEPLPFPDIVARELANLLDGVELGDDVDPQIAKALDVAGKNTWAVLAAGGGWVGVAGAVNAAGFAPYILAAQASAFIPFVGGPAAVSFLAVIVNPITLVAGILALGAFGGAKISKTIQIQVAARIAVLLAVRGLQDPKGGSAALVDSLRGITRPGASSLSYLSQEDRELVRQLVARLETRLGRGLPRAVGEPPKDLIELPLAEGPPSQLNEAAAVAGLTLAEMIYHAAAIDENVILAADFWRTAEISNPLSFAAHALELQAAGSDVALRGYVAERVVLGQLITDGHDVSLPDSPNNPGFDLIVDGQPVQVKCASGIDTLREHFEKYPDIPVLANAELVDKVKDEPWSNMVASVEGFDLEGVQFITDQALEHGVDLAAPDIIATALGVGAVRGALAVIQGEVPASDLPAWLVVDAALRTPLVFLGGKAGGLIGIIAIGPAGALILGPALAAVAVVGVGPAKELFGAVVNKDWHRGMIADAGALHSALLEALNTRANLVLRRRERLASAASSTSPEFRDWLDRRAAEDAIYAAELVESLPPAPKEPSGALQLVLEAMRGAPADPKVIKLCSALRTRMENRPGPLKGLADLWEILPNIPGWGVGSNGGAGRER